MLWYLVQIKWINLNAFKYAHINLVFVNCNIGPIVINFHVKTSRYLTSSQGHRIRCILVVDKPQKNFQLHLICKPNYIVQLVFTNQSCRKYQKKVKVPVRIFKSTILLHNKERKVWKGTYFCLRSIEFDKMRNQVIV